MAQASTLPERSAAPASAGLREDRRRIARVTEVDRAGVERIEQHLTFEHEHEQRPQALHDRHMRILLSSPGGQEEENPLPARQRVVRYHHFRVCAKRTAASPDYSRGPNNNARLLERAAWSHCRTADPKSKALCPLALH
jgi:hypothetical protein